VAFLAIESAVDDVPGIRQCGGKLTIEIWIILDHEETHGLFLRCATELDFAVHCIDGRGDYFATTAEQSQHIDQFLVMPAQPGADDFGILPVFPKIFNGLGK
jgi:hypothetical protein